MRKNQLNFGHCPKGGGGVQTESKAFEDLFEDLFSALVWTFSNEGGRGGEPIPKKFRNFSAKETGGGDVPNPNFFEELWLLRNKVKKKSSSNMFKDTGGGGGGGTVGHDPQNRIL